MFPKGRREPLQMVVQRRRREFNQPFRLADKDAHELWNSSQMECRYIFLWGIRKSSYAQIALQEEGWSIN